ncbi:MAG: hypothetical protein Q8R90_00615 [Bacteroidales bacterium]|nr:hypothetical protein [Bacteroidales bacterium]
MSGKLFKTLFLLGLSLIIFSCNGSDKGARERAKMFLDSYFSIDYEAAAGYCTPELGQDLKEALKNIESLEKGVKEMIIKQTSEIKTEITEVKLFAGNDSLTVYYKVYLSGFPNGIDNTLIMVKEDKEWKVAVLTR